MTGGDDDNGADGTPEVVACTYFDRERGPDLGTMIVRVVAEAEGVPPEELDGPPLYDRIDAEHLARAMFTPRAGGSRRTAATFWYHGYRVRVRGDGHVCAVDPGQA